MLWATRFMKYTLIFHMLQIWKFLSKYTDLSLNSKHFRYSWEQVYDKPLHYSQYFKQISHRTTKRITFSGSKVKSLSHVWLFATPWTVAYQAPPSMGFSRQECWSGLPFPSSRGSSRPRNWTRVSCIAGRLSEVNVKILLMTISWNWDFMEVLIIFVYKHFVFLYYLLHVWRKPELPLLKLQDLSYKVTKGKASGHFYIIVNYLWSDSYGSLRRSAVEPGTNLHFTYPNCW